MGGVAWSEEGDSQSVPSISNTTPHRLGASGVGLWPRGAKRCVGGVAVDAILTMVDCVARTRVAVMKVGRRGE